MPVREGKDKNGPYFQWGHHGKKYYYDPSKPKSKEIARDKAAKQGRAIKASQARQYSHFMNGGANAYYAEYLKYKQLYLDSKI